MKWIFDTYYHNLLAEDGIDESLAADIRAGRVTRADIDTMRTLLLNALDTARLYQCDTDVMQIMMNTAIKLYNSQLSLSLIPQLPTWIEFENEMGLTLNDMTIHALFIWNGHIELVATQYHGAMLEIDTVSHIVKMHMNPCRTICDRLDTSEQISVLNTPRRIDCACQKRLDAWLSVVVALCMILRSDGIEQTIIERRHWGKKTRATARERIPTQTHSTILHVTKKYVTPSDTESDEATASASPLPTHLVEIAPFIRHLDPARNSRWRTEKFVLVSGFIRTQHGFPIRTYVKK